MTHWALFAIEYVALKVANYYNPVTFLAKTTKRSNASGG